MRKHVLRVATCTLGVAASLLPALPSHAAAPVGAYVVVLKDGSAESPRAAAAVAETLGATVSFVYEHALRGYAAELTPAALAHLKNDPDVKYVEPDGTAYGTVDHANPPSWGLDRIDQRYRPLDRNYSYHSAGTLRQVYVLDSGINYAHGDFGGRAVPGFDAITKNGLAQDCHGHGTHVASTIGGGFYGVARATVLYGVRVLGCSNTGQWSQIIAGIDWVTAHHQPGSGAVANMSIGGPKYAPVEDAVRRSIADGITYTIAAGNNWNDNACNYSPSGVREAIVVGATDQNDSRAGFSNNWDCVDIWAPGVDIWAASHRDSISAVSMQGTSMAAPHVAGVAAQYLETDPTADPNRVWYWVNDRATKGIVGGANVAPNLLYTNFGILP